MANTWARLGEGDRALENMKIISRCCLGRNLFTYHNDWRGMGVTLTNIYGRSAPFQMDANFGISAAVTEMLCSSDPQILRLLPGLPSAWTSGEFHDVLTRTGIRTSAKWDMDKNTIDLTLTAERNTSFDLKFPGEIDHLECSDPEVLRESSYGATYRSLRLEEGEQIRMQIVLK